MGSNIQVEERTAFKRIDLNLVLVIIALNIIGLINLYSATHGAQSKDINRLFLSQIGFLSVGWTVFLVTTFLDYRFFCRLAYVFYGVNLIFIGLTDIFGRVTYGAQRWLDLGFFKYQPSETMKLVIILLLAKVLSSKERGPGLSLKELFFPFFLMLIPFGLVAKQPDLGTALMIIIIGMSMVLFVGVRRYLIVTAILGALISVPMLWKFGLKDYQKNRILTFVDPGRDPRGAGYNSIQSKIAVGSGKLLGKGFRKGTQSQLEFLPERHTDFIFSVLSEEHGFFGSITVVSLFAILMLLGTRIISQAGDKMGALVTLGVLAMVFWHMFINIGMVIGLLPIVGIPLPLLSYGGSSLLTTMFGLGLVSSVAMRRYLF